MGRTALELTREEWQAFRPGIKTGAPQVAERWERAWRVARAAWGIAPGAFYRAAAVVSGSRSAFKVHLVAPGDCPPTLRRVIEQEGVALRVTPL